MKIHLEMVGWLGKEQKIKSPADFEVPFESSVEYLLKELDLTNYPTVIFVNNQKVERKYRFKKGDNVKVVPIVGGG